MQFQVRSMKNITLAICFAICATATVQRTDAAATSKPTQVSPQIVKLMNVKPGATNTLAAVRQLSLTNNGGALIRSRAINKIFGSMTGPKHAELVGYDPCSDFGIQPVALTPRISAPPLVAVELNDARVRYVNEPDLAMTPKGISLRHGTAIVEALNNLSIELPEGRVDLKGGTVVKVSALNGTYRVVNIVDSTHDAVTVHVCRRHFVLRPGEEARYSIDKDLVAARIHDGCGRRNERDNSCCTYSIKVDEISVAALLKHDPIGQQIYLSQSNNDKALRNRVMKAAAAIAFWSKARTPYSWE
jgi:hypothetical protein